MAYLLRIVLRIDQPVPVLVRSVTEFTEFISAESDSDSGDSVIQIQIEVNLQI